MDATSWLQLVDRYGLPLVALVVVFGLGVWGIRAVWKFARPVLQKVSESFLNLIQKQSDFIDTVQQHQAELKALVELGLRGDRSTHDKLETIRSKVDAIHEHTVVGGRGTLKHEVSQKLGGR